LVESASIRSGSDIPFLRHGERVICCGGNGDWNWNKGCGIALEDHQRGNISLIFIDKTQLEPLTTSSFCIVPALATGKDSRVSDVASLTRRLRVTWLTGVIRRRCRISFRFSARQDLHESRWRIAARALTAIAMHADLPRQTMNRSWISQRSRCANKLCSGSVKRAGFRFQTLKTLLKRNSTEVRSQITFALSLNHEAGALDK